jgi:hypothetical protein
MNLPPTIAARFAALGVRVRVNRNRRTLVSLRDQRRGPPVLSIHEALLGDPLVLEDVARFVRHRGGGRYPVLQRAMETIVGSQTPSFCTDADVALIRDLEPIGTAFDFAACFRDIHAHAFNWLPLPMFRWGRNPGSRRLRSIRFGSYRARPQATVLLNPRLDQPWVARFFVEHVLHHELVHHLQACDRLRGEAHHSPRFRALERGYQHIELAWAWETANLQRLLAPPSDATVSEESRIDVFRPSVMPEQEMPYRDKSQQFA